MTLGSFFRRGLLVGLTFDFYLPPSFGRQRNSLNNFSARPNESGSYTIRFGGDSNSENYLPITEGWNYAIRMYQPQEAILGGSWVFPAITPAN